MDLVVALVMELAEIIPVQEVIGYDQPLVVLRESRDVRL
jgi:hypothetical protein